MRSAEAPVVAGRPTHANDAVDALLARIEAIDLA